MSECQLSAVPSEYVSKWPTLMTSRFLVLTMTILKPRPPSFRPDAITLYKHKTFIVNYTGRCYLRIFVKLLLSEHDYSDSYNWTTR